MSVPDRILNDLFAQKLSCEESPTEGNYKVSVRLASGRWAMLAKNLSEEMATALTAGIRDRLSEVRFARKIVPPKRP